MLKVTVGSSFRLSNPSRLTQIQMKSCKFDLEQRFVPVATTIKTHGIIAETESPAPCLKLQGFMISLGLSMNEVTHGIRMAIWAALIAFFWCVPCARMMPGDAARNATLTLRAPLECHNSCNHPARQSQSRPAHHHPPTSGASSL